MCPRCRTTKYRNPSLKMMVNSCGHGICDNCVEQLFSRGSGNCPVCDTNLRKAGYRLQIFSDSQVEKEVDIRKRILKDFNKKEEDFESLKEYNDYLERVETIIFNLTNDVNVDETKRQVETYKKENAELIARNRSKKSKDEELIDQLIEEEKELQAFRKEIGFRQDALTQMTRVKNQQKEELVDELMYSDASATEILASHSQMASIALKEQQKLVTEREEQEMMTVMQIMKRKNEKGKFSTGIEFGRGLRVSDQLVPEEADELYRYEAEVLDLNGPPVPNPEELDEEGYLMHVRTADRSERAAGFKSLFPCYRAVQEAFSSLFFSPEVDHDPDADPE